MAQRTASDADEVVAELENAREALEEARAAIRETGEAELERVRDALESFKDLLDEYQEQASGTGRETFEKYVEFEGKLADFEESLPEDLPRRGAFEAACDRLDRRRLDERDFELARDDLDPVRAFVEDLHRRDRAEERLRQARDAVQSRIHEIDDRIDELDDLLQFASTDLEAPVADLRDPIETYNEAVDQAFRTYRRESSARAVLDLVASTATYPLVEYREPPTELREYLDSAEVGTETIPTLLEYVDYSRSKLSHYVDDPASFRGAVATNRTYLERLDADPLEFSWPPPPAEELEYRVREYLPIVDRFAPDDILVTLRTVRSLPREVDYERLRETARARETLSESEREALAEGDLAAERERLQRERDRLETALHGSD